MFIFDTSNKFTVVSSFINSTITREITHNRNSYNTSSYIFSKKFIKLAFTVIAATASASDLSKAVYVYDGGRKLDYNAEFMLSGYSAAKTTATVTITGKDNYTGTTTAKLTVYNVSSDKIINPENVRLNMETVTYTGRAIKTVEPAVTIGGITLTKNRDYKVQYQNNKNVGTAYVIVTGKGAYKGKAVIPFKINAAAVSSSAVMIKPISAKTYNGKLQKPKVTVTVNNKKLAKNKDYIVTYRNNLHAGIATVTVTGKGNYASIMQEIKFTINAQHIKKAAVKGTQNHLTLTYSKRTLKEGSDYESPVYGSSNKIKVKVTIKGKGDFTGEVTKSVKIQ